MAGQRQSAAEPGDRRLRHIAIVGGGTAGWMAAAMLARALPGYGCAITVVESPDIGAIGVGEATIPPIIDLLRFLGIDEADFVRHTQSTYKLGIKFIDWRRIGASYWHPFGTFGVSINRRPFFHAWHKAVAEGMAPRFNDFSLCAALGDAGRYRPPDPADPGPVSGLRYALHFDAGLVARYLRAYAERLGVRCLERTVATATQHPDGRLDALVFKQGGELAADLFIDCSGFRGVLIEQILNTGYVDWTDVLPCDRAVAVPTELASPRGPYTLSSARPAGWRWRIPLQHRAGNGYVYSSAHLDDEAAWLDLLTEVGETPLAEPRFLRFATGRRKRFWSGNCIALGLASGFIEPLESTSIHLVMSGVYNLLEHFPDRDLDPANIAAYNAELIEEIERIRDFVVLHYCATQRDDTAFWDYCRTMPPPDSLTERIERYKATGRVRPRHGELFSDLSWFYVLDGLGVTPKSYDPLMDVVPSVQLREILGRLAQSTAEALRGAPTHDSHFPAPSSQREAVATAG
jgi:tryptophan halogenase